MKNKQFVAGFAKEAKGATVTEDQLAKINTYAFEPLTAEQVYVRKVRLAHNAIDRDNERFSEALLDDFVRTLPGKSFLIGHQLGPPGKGLFFDAATEEIHVEQAKALTSEELKLPEGIKTVKFLMGWFYAAKTPGKEELLADIDAGVARHVSIGFNASNLARVSNEQNGETLYFEYKAPGEALEGSLVWLGAQPGAMVTKSSDGQGVDDKNQKKEGKRMKGLLKKLGLNEDSSEESAVKALDEKLLRLKGLEDIAEAVGEDATVESIRELKAQAEDGKAYRKDLVGRQIKAERLLGRVGDKPEDVTTREKQLAKRDISEIQGDIKHMEALVADKFPGESRIAGDGSDSRREATQRKTFRKGGNE